MTTDPRVQSAKALYRFAEMAEPWDCLDDESQAFWVRSAALIAEPRESALRSALVAVTECLEIAHENASNYRPNCSICEALDAARALLGET